MERLEKFIDERIEMYINDLWYNYGVQRDNSGKKFIYSNILTLEELKETIIDDINTYPFDELIEEGYENYDDLSDKRRKELDIYLDSLIDTIVIDAYNNVIKARFAHILS